MMTYINDEGSFLCESCDRSWETSEELDEHIASHVSCSVEGCSFSAHPKIVDLHFKFQHATGLFERIPKTSDSKEIEAWIAERRKKYPTKGRVEEKEAEKLEKIARGEVLEDPTPRPKLSTEPRDIRSQKNSAFDCRNRKPLGPHRKKVRAPHRLVVGNTRIEVVDGLPPDYEANKKALIEMSSAVEEVEDENFDISEDELDIDMTPVGDTSKGMCSVLSALCAAYDSTYSDDDGPPTERKAVVTKAADGVPTAEDSIVAPEPPVNESSTNEEKLNNQRVTHSRKRVRKRTVKEDAKKPRRILPPPSSLLQKLLAKDIRKERNQILQCVRFIVDNEFFDSSKKSCERSIKAAADDLLNTV